VIAAVLFDLDGTLIQTEELKARSYAEAARELDPAVDGEGVVAEFSHLAGQSRETVARRLVEQFHLPGSADELVRLRLERYDAMLADRDLLRRQALPETIALLQRVRREFYRTALTTMSDPAHAGQILAALDLSDAFEVVITPADVVHGKPAPDMFVAVTSRLGLPPGDCIALEDSVAGITAARAAGVPCIAVPTWLTRDAVRQAGVVGPEWIVEDPERLAPVFEERVAALRESSTNRKDA
jgi:HAD superfamily hydrolase (TIGR01509 family)